MRRPSIEELRSLCIKEDWFTAGSSAQYEKMFDMLRDGEPMDKIAFTIAFCSDEVYEHEVLIKMEETFPETFEVTLNEWEAATICDALGCYIDNADITEIDDLDGVKQLLQRFI